MAYELQTGSVGLRAEVVDSIVKQTAARAYKLKQAVAAVPTSSWKNTFFREDPTILAGPSGNAIKGLPPGANFPQAVVKWEEITSRIIKHGLEDNINWEDILSGAIDVQARTIIKLTEAVVKSVDDNIWDTLTQNVMTDSSLVIQSYAITLGRYWDASSAAIIKDVMTAKSQIGKKNYDVSDLLCFVHPDDATNVTTFLIDKGAQFPQIAADATRTGQIGKIGNVTFIESLSVAASYALLLKPKTCATYKELVSLRSTTVEDPYKSLKIRVVEEGIVQLTDPGAIVLIKGTKSP